MTDETARLLADLARAKAVFQQRPIVALLTERSTGHGETMPADNPE